MRSLNSFFCFGFFSGQYPKPQRYSVYKDAADKISCERTNLCPVNSSYYEQPLRARELQAQFGKAVVKTAAATVQRSVAGNGNPTVQYNPFVKVGKGSQINNYIRSAVSRVSLSTKEKACRVPRLGLNLTF